MVLLFCILIVFMTYVYVYYFIRYIMYFTNYINAWTTYKLHNNFVSVNLIIII